MDTMFHITQAPQEATTLITPKRARGGGRPPNPWWVWFMKSDEKINSSHYKATCKACINAGVPEAKCSITGIGDSMKNHLLKCPNTPDQEKERVQTLAEQISAEQAAQQQAQHAHAAGTITIPNVISTPLQGVNIFSIPSSVDGKRKSFGSSKPYNKRGRYDDMTKNESDAFEKQLLRATVSANLPLTWVEDPEVRKAMDLIRPGIHMPTKRALENRVLKWVDDEIKNRGDTYLRSTRHFNVTMGWWDDGNGRRWAATNVVTAERHLVPAVDVSQWNADAKGDDVVVSKLRTVMDRLDNFESSICVAVVTDSTAAFRKGRRELVKERPTVLGLDSGPGQLALLGAQMVKDNEWMKRAMVDVVEVLEFVNDHTFSCNRVWLKQDEVNGHRLLLKTPNASDWTSFWYSTTKLLESGKAIRETFVEQRAPISESFASIGKAEQAEKLLTLVDSDDFWHRTLEFNRLFGPIERSYKALRKANSRLDAHLLTLAQLHRTYQADPDVHVAASVTRAIETKWERMEQSLFVLAYFLHPAKHLRNLNLAEPIVQSHIIAQQASKYYERLFQTKSEGLLGEIAKYYHKRSPFEPTFFEDRQLTGDPSLFWELFKNAAPALSALATRLFAICLDSDGVAQVMEELNWVHDLRTLHPDKLSAFVRAKLQNGADHALDPMELPRLAPLTVNLASTGMLPPGATMDDIAQGWELGADYDDTRVARPLKTERDTEDFLNNWLGQLDQEVNLTDAEDSGVWGDEESRCPMGRLFVFPLTGEFDLII